MVRRRQKKAASRRLPGITQRNASTQRVCSQVSTRLSDRTAQPWDVLGSRLRAELHS